MRKVLGLNMSHTNKNDTKDELEKAKELMGWDRYGEPTLLEYLRYWKNGDLVGERYIIAAYEQYATDRLIKELERLYDKTPPECGMSDVIADRFEALREGSR